MADNTIIQQGRFTSTGAAQTLQIRADVDWMKVVNMTEAAAANASRGITYYWQRGFTDNDGLVTLRNAAATEVNMDTSAGLAVPGFRLVDSSSNPVGVLTAVTSISNATPPRVTVASTAALATGNIVRLIDITGGQQLGGYDFTITVIGATTFDLEYMAPIVAATTGFYRLIRFEPIFYPRHRSISAITQAASAVVTMTVTHGFTVGQVVRLRVPAAFGMVEIDGLSGTITAINTTTNTITLDIDSTTFTAFAFPLTAAPTFSQALVIPVGEAATSPYENLLDDATVNTAYLGMQLGAGITSPAGSASDVIYWVAGKSFSVDNL